MASVLIIIKAECGVSASVDTQGQNLTIFCQTLICLDSGTKAE